MHVGSGYETTHFPRCLALLYSDYCINTTIKLLASNHEIEVHTFNFLVASDKQNLKLLIT